MTRARPIDERNRRIVSASWIAISANGVLAVAKVVVGMVGGSYAVISDGIDSGADILASLLTLVTAHIMSRPPDAKFPFGYSRADTLATKVLSFIIFFAGIELVIESIRHMAAGVHSPLPTTGAFIVTGVSLVGKIGLAFFLRRLGKKVDSKMLIANGRNMQGDVGISLVVIVGLVLVQLTGIRQIDTIAALLVSVWIIRVAVVIFFETNTELMDGTTDTKIYDRVFSAVSEVPGASNPHRVRIRRLGHVFVVVLDIEVDGDMSVHAAHEIAMETERIIVARVPEVYDVIVHVEPAGSGEHVERFGLSDTGPVDTVDTGN